MFRSDWTEEEVALEPYPEFPLLHTQGTCPRCRYIGMPHTHIDRNRRCWNGHTWWEWVL